MEKITRRHALIRVVGAAAGLVAVSACQKSSGVQCAAPGQLTRSQQAARDGRKYVEASNVSGKSCANCTFFKVAGGDCGACAIDDLPANPEGYCISWSQAESAQYKKTGGQHA